MLPEVGPSPVFSKVGVPMQSSVPAEARVTRRVSSSVLLAAAVSIRAAAAIGGSSYKEYF